MNDRMGGNLSEFKFVNFNNDLGLLAQPSIKILESWIEEAPKSNAGYAVVAAADIDYLFWHSKFGN